VPEAEVKLDPPVAQLGSPGDKAVLVTDWPSLPLAPFWPGAPGYGRNPLRAIAIVTTAALVSLAYQHAWDWLPALVTVLVVVSLALIAWQATSAGDDAVAKWLADR
jgi:hypothetical protein